MLLSICRKDAFKEDIMKLIQWTFFIDMLGYRVLNGEIDSEEKAKEFIAFMEQNKAIFDLSNSSEVKSKYSKDKVFNLYEYYDVKYSFISDSLVINIYPKEVPSLKNEKLKYMHSANALIIILMRLQTFIFACFQEKGLFLRGGISTKYCFLEGNFAVGEGLIDAYLTESKIAKHPRIAFSESVFKDEKLLEQVELLSHKMYGNSILNKDTDGVYYLDHLGYSMSSVDRDNKMVCQFITLNLQAYLAHLEMAKNYVNKHAIAIQKKLTDLEAELSDLHTEKEREKQQYVINKFEWLKGYHNASVSQYKDFVEFTID